MASSFPGQSDGLCGQASQVASCRSHSAGIEKPSAAGVASGGAASLIINSREDSFPSVLVQSPITRPPGPFISWQSVEASYGEPRQQLELTYGQNRKTARAFPG